MASVLTPPSPPHFDKWKYEGEAPILYWINVMVFSRKYIGVILKTNTQSLKPLLVNGTGFHCYAKENNPEFECLYSWQKLLKIKAANRIGLPSLAYLTDNPTLQLEQLLWYGLAVDIYDEQENAFSAK